MRRSARVLSATALAGAALGIAAPAASADPAAEVTPRSVAPGGTVSISVSCDTTGGPPPDSIEAGSQGFEDGKVQLRRVDGNEDSTAGAAYTGTARIPPAGTSDDGPDAVGPQSELGVDGLCPVAPGGKEKQWTTSFNVARDGTTGGDQDGTGGDQDGTGGDQGGTGGDEGGVTGRDQGGTGGDEGGATGGDQGGVTGRDQGGTGGDEGGVTGGDQGGTGRDQGGTTGGREPVAPPVGVQHGVRAGGGGAFTASVPALVTGGILVAGACGAAVYRLRRGGPSTDR